MIAPDNEQWQTISWNAIRLERPADWEPIVSGKTHILFEQEFRPVFELRWQRPGKRSRESMDAALARIARESGLPELTPIPPHWKKYSDKYAIKLLAADEGDIPKAAIFICRECKSTLLFYFFKELTGRLHQDMLQLISSIRCHQESAESGVLWKIQDFQVSTPEYFSLSGYNFGAGLTRLSFVHKGFTMHLCRLAGAGQRLRDSSLLNLLNLLGDLNIHEDSARYRENEVSHRSYPSITQQIRCRIRRESPFHWAVLRHHPELDRISGLFFFDKKPIPENLVSSMEESYEIFPL